MSARSEETSFSPYRENSFSHLSKLNPTKLIRRPCENSFTHLLKLNHTKLLVENPVYFTFGREFVPSRSQRELTNFIAVPNIRVMLVSKNRFFRVWADRINFVTPRNFGPQFLSCRVLCINIMKSFVSCPGIYFIRYYYIISRFLHYSLLTLLEKNFYHSLGYNLILALMQTRDSEEPCLQMYLYEIIQGYISKSVFTIL